MSSENIPQSQAIEQFINVTPAGCYYAAESRAQTISRELLHRIMAAPHTSPISAFEGADNDGIQNLLRSGFVSLGATQQFLPEGNFSDLLPTVLPALSERERVVFAESKQGFYLDFSGVSKAEAIELAVLAADLRSISEKRSTLLKGQLSIDSRAFGIVDPAGNSEIGFWPLYISDNVFTLIVIGIPRFNSPQFCILVWALIERYGPNCLTQ